MWENVVQNLFEGFIRSRGWGPWYARQGWNLIKDWPLSMPTEALTYLGKRYPDLTNGGENVVSQREEWQAEYVSPFLEQMGMTELAPPKPTRAEAIAAARGQAEGHGRPVRLYRRFVIEYGWEEMPLANGE